MDRESENFVMDGEASVVNARRRHKLLGLRGALGGVYYGTAAFGYPLGAISGVQTPTDPPVNPDQFGDTGATQGSGDAGTTGGGDSGGTT